MISLDISDASVEALKLKKSLFGKLNAFPVGRIELEEGIVKRGEILEPQKLAEKINSLVKKGKISFTLPDLRTFTYRLFLPADISRSAVKSFLREKAVEVVPFELNDLVYDFKIVNQTEEGKEVLFIAIAKKILANYLKTFALVKLTPLWAVPESLATFEIFKQTVVKEEIILYLDVGAKTSTFSFFDRFGPFLTLNEPAKTNDLEKEIQKATEFLKEKHHQEIKRIILSGGGSLEIDGEAFSKKIGIWTTKADKILSDRLTKASLRFKAEKQAPVLFLNVLGLSLLIQRKEELNLLKETKNLLVELKEEETKEKPSSSKTSENKKIAEDKGEKEETEQEEKTEEIEKEAQKKSLFKTILIVIFFACLTFLAIYFLIKKPFVFKKETKLTISPMVPETISVTPEKKLERKDLAIRVLNGSGIAGKAGEVAAELEKLGYQISETGNADTFDYQETVIKIKEEKKDYLSLLTNDLKTLYTVRSEETFLNKEEEVDVIVIVGKE